MHPWGVHATWKGMVVKSPQFIGGGTYVGGGAKQGGGVERMETVYVLVGVDGTEDGILVEVGGEGELHEYAVNGVVGVEVGYFSKESFHGNVVGIVVPEAGDAAFVARLLLHSDVGLGIAPGSYEDYGEAGYLGWGGGFEVGDGVLDFGSDGRRRLPSRQCRIRSSLHVVVCLLCLMTNM